MALRFSHYLKLMTLWGIHSTGRPNDNNGNKNTNNNNNNIGDQHSRDTTCCWTKGTCRVDGWIRANLAFWQFLSSTFFSIIWSSVFFIRFLETWNCFGNSKERHKTWKISKVSTSYKPILKAGLPLNPGNLQMVNSGQSSKFWLTDPPLHRWFKARPTLFMQSSPLIFFASNLSKQEHRQERKKKFGRSLNIVIPRKREKQNVIVHMDIKEEEKGNINVCIVF